MVRQILPVIAVITLIVFSGCLAADNGAEKDNPSQRSIDEGTPGTDSDGDVTVFITEQGRKYHRADCPHLTNGGRPIFLEEAKKRGYTPCKACKPKE